MGLSLFVFNNFSMNLLILLFSIFVMAESDAATLSAIGSDGVNKDYFRWDGVGYPGIQCEGSTNVTMTVKFQTNTRTTKCDGTMVASAQIINPFQGYYVGDVTFENTGQSDTIISIQWGIHGSTGKWPITSRTIPASNRCSIEYNPSVKIDSALNENPPTQRIVSNMKGVGELTVRPSIIIAGVPNIVNASNPDRTWGYNLTTPDKKGGGSYVYGLKQSGGIDIFPGRPIFPGIYSGAMTLTLSCD